MRWKKAYKHYYTNSLSALFSFSSFSFATYFSRFKLFHKIYLEKHNPFSHLFPFYISDLFLSLILISHYNIFLNKKILISLFPLSFKVIYVLSLSPFLQSNFYSLFLPLCIPHVSLAVSPLKILHKSKTRKKLASIYTIFVL